MYIRIINVLYIKTLMCSNIYITEYHTLHVEKYSGKGLIVYCVCITKFHVTTRALAGTKLKGGG